MVFKIPHHFMILCKQRVGKKKKISIFFLFVMLKLPTAHQPGQESQAVKAYLPSEVKNTFEKERDGDSILPLFHYTSLPTVFTLQLL